MVSRLLHADAVVRLGGWWFVTLLGNGVGRRCAAADRGRAPARRGRQRSAAPIGEVGARTEQQHVVRPLGPLLATLRREARDQREGGAEGRIPTPTASGRRAGCSARRATS